MDRQGQPEQYKKSTADFIESASGSSQPGSDPVRCAGHQILNDELHDCIGQRDSDCLRDDASLRIQERWNKRSEEQQCLGV